MKVNVKWGKELFKDVEIDTDENPEQFKWQLYSMSGVPVDRMKVMGKGGMLQNEQWGKVKVTEGCTFTMIGTAEDLPQATEEGVQFVEDLPEEVRSKPSTAPGHAKPVMPMWPTKCVWLQTHLQLALSLIMASELLT